jgi:tetratricopeptide (TPR) repeat protein
MQRGFVARFVASVLFASGVCAGHPNHPPAAGEAGPEVQALEESRKDAAVWEAKVAQSPEDARYLSALGDAWLKVARITTDHLDFARSEAAFRKVYAADPLSDWAPYGLAYALLGQHRFKESHEFARRAAFQHPEETETLALICDVHLALGNSIEARAIAQRMADEKLTLESLSRLALAHQACGDMDKALVSMREAFEAGGLLDAKPKALAWCRSMLGDFALETGDLESARAEHEAALLLDPGCHHARWQLAKLDLRDGKATDARDAMLSVTASYPKPVYFVTLGDAHKAVGGADGEKLAAAAYKDAESRMLKEIDAKGLGHIRELAEFWLSHGGDANKAAELALRDVNEVRQDFGAFDTAAWALFKAGRASEAVPMALEGQMRNAGDIRSKCRAGIVLASAGRVLEGRQLLARALLSREAMEPALAEEADRLMERTATGLGAASTPGGAGGDAGGAGGGKR